MRPWAVRCVRWEVVGGGMSQGRGGGDVQQISSARGTWRAEQLEATYLLAHVAPPPAPCAREREKLGPNRSTCRPRNRKKLLLPPTTPPSAPPSSCGRGLSLRIVPATPPPLGRPLGGGVRSGIVLSATRYLPRWPAVQYRVLPF